MSSINLTETEARHRSELITVKHYDITLDVTGTERFSSRTVVRFFANDAGSTFIDMRTDDVTSAILDGTALDVSGYDAEYGIGLDLSPGEHILEVEATVAYSRTGEGLHRAVDAADNEIYLYTQFEAADAKRVFACFDQPDMKATYDMTVSIPEGTTLITNEPVQHESGTTYTSSIDYPLSTYLLAFCVGPYAEFSDEWRGQLTRHPETPAEAPGSELRVPMNIYARKSLAEHVDHERLFKETKQGFDFYHRNFGVAYPFSKYDQVFVPEFNAGAMENAGCVTIRDEYIFPSEPTHYRYERRADTILHELAHMWFGDLVTMKWWGDLWLNESFATWSAAISQAEETQYDTAWVTFANVEKAWAYAQDQLPTTHPISTDASDIETVEQNFDGITYAKGASVLKQLQAYVGREEFFAGVRSHFAQHAWSNATFDDLLSALEKASGRDLSFWADQWLKTTGVNTLSPAFEIRDGAYSAFAVRQSGDTLRTHRIGIGIYSLEGEKVVRTHRVEADIDGDTTEIAELIGVKAGDFVLVNDDDLTYALLDLDDASLEFIMEHIAKIDDPMARTLCWSAVWEMTRDGLISAQDFVALVARGIESETELAVAERLLSQATQAQAQYAQPEWARTDTTLASVCLRGAHSANAEAARIFENALAQTVLSQAAADYLESILETEEEDSERRWRALTALTAQGFSTDALRIDDEAARDKTSAGVLAARRARAALPDADNKARVFEAIVHGELSNLEARHDLQGLTFPGYGDLLNQFNERYFEVAHHIWNEQSTELALNALVGLYPSWDITEEGIARADVFLEQDLPGGLRRVVSEQRDRQQRALRNRKLAD